LNRSNPLSQGSFKPKRYVDCIAAALDGHRDFLSIARANSGDEFWGRLIYFFGLVLGRLSQEV
jgi:hypothetical protein